MSSLNKPNKTYYKLTRRGQWYNREYGFNSCADLMTDVFTVIYNIGMAARPSFPGSKLFIFDTEANARAFLDLHPSARSYTNLWEVGATNVSRPKFLSVDGVRKKEFWENRNKKRRANTFARPVPPGTLWADSVTLLRQIPL